MIVETAPILINIGFCCSKHDSIYYTYYVGIVFFAQKHLLGFICDGFHLKDFLR